MSEQNVESIDDLLAECQQTIDTARELGYYLLELKNKGVVFVDNNMEPWFTDGKVIQFPTHRRIQ